MKCILDVGCTVTLHLLRDKRQVFPDAVLSRWPVNCPAYAAGLKNLLKRSYTGAAMKRSLKHKLLRVQCVVAKRLGGNPPHCVPSTLAQLCWQKRAWAKNRVRNLRNCVAP